MSRQFIIFILIAGCANRPIAKNIKSLHLSSNLNEAKSSQLVVATDCSYKIIGQNVTPVLSAHRAFLRAGKNGKVQSFLNISIEAESIDFFVYRKDCLVVKARGIK